jgi:eukaryotic-like serine/threonine-protein kinase
LLSQEISGERTSLLYLFDNFELSEEEFALRRHGKRISVEPRALSLLMVLAANHGKLLDKKKLMEAVWKETFVEETTLTRAIAVIRKQLEDDPRTPKYIETIPTRGYRFIVPVEVRHSEPKDPVLPPAPPTVVELSDVDHDSIEDCPANATAPREREGHRLRYAAAIGIGLTFLAVIFIQLARSRSELNTSDILVLGDFTNRSGDPVFDDALRQGMLVQLEQSPVLRMASDVQIRKTLKMMGLRSDVFLTPEIGREICQRIGGTVVLNGSISRLGNEYVIGLRAQRCSTGEELDAEQAQVGRKEDALIALGHIATQLRTKIGEAKSTIRDLDTPLAEATTSSLDALRAFSQGIRVFNAKGSAAAIPLFQQATELDPAFATAHVWLGRMYADLGRETSSIESTERAHTLRGRASDRERFLIDVSYDLLVTGDLEKAKATCDAWGQMYPRDVYPRAFLSGVIYPAYGQHDRALQEAREAIAIDPDFVVGYRNAVMNLTSLNRLEEAQEVLKQASEQKVFLPSFVTDSYKFAFLMEDRDGMQKALDAAPKNPWLLHYQAATLAHNGQLAKARSLRKRALELAQIGSRQEMQAQLMISGAFTELFYGNLKDAAIQAQTALQLSASRNVRASAALVLAMSGQSDKALSLVNDLRKRFPQDTVLRDNYLPATLASIALRHEQPQQALKLLEPASQFELSVPLYPVYLRGQAYLSLGQRSQAIAEFRKIVDHPGLVLNDPLLNFAQIDLGLAYAQAGEREKAKAALEKVRQRWSHVDENFPALVQVKRVSSEL